MPGSRTIAAVAPLLGLVLTGCVSASAPPPATPPASQSASAAKVCTLLTREDLRDALDIGFLGPRILPPPNGSRSVECQWTGDDGTSYAITKVTEQDAAFRYRAVRKATEASIGPVTVLDVPHADEAFFVPNIARTVMLVNGRLVQLDVLASTATSEGVRDLILVVARRASRS